MDIVNDTLTPTPSLLLDTWKKEMDYLYTVMGSCKIKLTCNFTPQCKVHRYIQHRVIKAGTVKCCTSFVVLNYVCLDDLVWMVWLIFFSNWSKELSLNLMSSVPKRPKTLKNIQKRPKTFHKASKKSLNVQKHPKTSQNILKCSKKSKMSQTLPKRLKTPPLPLKTSQHIPKHLLTSQKVRKHP